MNHRIDRIAHTTAFVTPVVPHWLEREGGWDARHNSGIDPTNYRTTSGRYTTKM